ncbi:DODA-type extradiol aromatic ring-opening family dioxygenase [Stygiolobus caldivivus]|uniref:Dioxygenase n=1 Tax=Stygiolobus caldivivus TaxID=2824673 RepID=A0A8D5U556_9CREN|nr:dioxygenase [Stygiolobus caldivivus]BCU69656.1 dioxygenase [Stygiolobus caldivivus]
MLGLLASHGSPTILTEEVEWKKELQRIGKEIRETYNPGVVLVFSPHFISWSNENFVEIGNKLRCIQDFYGFPEELYKFCYEAENDVELAETLSSFLTPDSRWGLDHGAWIPLYYMFPEGIRVVTVSISNKSHEEHYQLGKRIGEVLRDSGRRPLVLATSSPTHRLDLYYLSVRPRPTMFDLILQDLIDGGRFDEIVNAYKVYAKEFKEAMPEGELKTLDMLLGVVQPSKGKVIAYDTPWPGVSMMLASFNS